MDEIWYLSDKIDILYCKIIQLQDENLSHDAGF